MHFYFQTENIFTYMHRAGFQLSFEVIWFLVSKARTNFSTNEKQNTKPIVTYSHAFSRARRQLHVFPLSSDWSIVPFTSVGIVVRAQESPSHCEKFTFVEILLYIGAEPS